VAIRRHRDPPELAPVQPVHETVFAAVDHDIPRACVNVIEHRLPACRAVNLPLARILAAWQRGPKRPGRNGTHGIDDRRETVHLDQRAETARAADQRVTFKPGR
jgi:hypothetical protein